MTDTNKEIMAIARRKFVAEKTWGHVVERAALLGAYDNGTYVQKHIPEAEREFLRTREESHDE